jgi:hypothetical protein
MTLVGMEKTRHHTKEGRLSRAIGTNETDECTGGNADVHCGEGGKATEANGHAVRRKDGRRSGAVGGEWLSNGHRTSST